jgi:multidrug efflux pump subunit AcrB
VGIRQIDVGNIISPSTTNGLVVVTQLNPISLIFTLPETDLPQIQLQQQRSKAPLPVLALMVMFGTIALTGYLYVVIPKAFFPQQDTGLIIGQSEAAQDISFDAMAERQQALLDAIMRDPSVATIGSAVGTGGST